MSDAQGPGEESEDQALSVLRGIWTAHGQSAADIEAAPSSAKVCRNMKNIGFSGIADGGGDGGSTAGPVDRDVRNAWRDQLEREGKIAPGASSLRDLLLGANPSDAAETRP